MTQAMALSPAPTGSATSPTGYLIDDRETDLVSIRPKPENRTARTLDKMLTLDLPLPRKPFRRRHPAKTER